MKLTTEKLISFRKGILKELVNSKKLGNLLGVQSPALGNEICLTAVEDVYSSGSDEVVVLKWYDKSAHILSRTHVFLEEIISVCSLKKASIEANMKQVFSMP